jgi:hypothetical protein
MDISTQFAITNADKSQQASVVARENYSVTSYYTGSESFPVTSRMHTGTFFHSFSPIDFVTFLRRLVGRNIFSTAGGSTTG